MRDKKEKRKMMVKNLKLWSFSFLFSLFSLLSTKASMLLPQKAIALDELSNRAEIVFKGTVQEKKQDRVAHPVTGEQIPLDVYLFKVEEVIKGDFKPGDTYTVKEIGVRTRQEADRLRVGFVARHSFELGKNYLLFLGAPNAFGVRSLIGGDSGKHTMTKEPKDKEFIEKVKKSLGR